MVKSTTHSTRCAYQWLLCFVLVILPKCRGSTWFHDDVINWKHFPRYWPFVRGIHWSPLNSQRPVTRSFDVFFDLRLNKRLSKQSWGWWFETLPWSLWRHWNVFNLLWHSDTTWRRRTLTPLFQVMTNPTLNHHRNHCWRTGQVDPWKQLPLMYVNCICP